MPRYDCSVCYYLADIRAVQLAWTFHPIFLSVVPLPSKLNQVGLQPMVDGAFE